MTELFNLRITLMGTIVRVVVNKSEMDKLIKLADSSDNMVVDKLDSWKLNI